MLAGSFAQWIVVGLVIGLAFKGLGKMAWVPALLSGIGTAFLVAFGLLLAITYLI